MKAHLGQAGVWLALIAASLGCLLLVVDQVRQRRGKAPSTVLDGRLLIPLAVLGALMATAAMQWALITHDFSIAYVAENNARVTPLIYSITGM
jgi:cytochrome c-type biogenesis protein CcmF